MEVGNFVKVTQLKSDEGSALNGKIGIIRGVDEDGGRVRVELIGRMEEWRSEIEMFDWKYLSINEENLVSVSSERTHAIFYKYLHYKFLLVQDSDERISILEEKFSIHGFVPSWNENATMATLLRLSERIKESLPYLKKSIEQIPPQFPDRNKLLYNYSAGLLLDGRIEEALEAALDIEEEQSASDWMEADYHARIKRFMIGMIANKCGTTPPQIYTEDMFGFKGPELD